MKIDTIVVGGGIFGSVIARKLLSVGHDVIVIDNARPNRGSGPAACLIKPSWLGSMGERVEPSLRLLQDLYGVRTVKFRTIPMGVETDVFWVPPSAILNDALVKSVTVSGTVNRVIDNDTVQFRDIDDRLRYLTADNVVVAAGVWTGAILESPGLMASTVAQAGQAFLFPEQKVDQPFINVWAPYKQLVGFNRGDGAWIGDGAAIIQKNWTPVVAAKNTVRIHEAAERAKVHGQGKPLFGLRPYVKDAKPLYMEEHRPGVWAVTGGAKNGTIAAAWAAHYLGERL